VSQIVDRFRADYRHGARVSLKKGTVCLEAEASHHFDARHASATSASRRIEHWHVNRTDFVEVQDRRLLFYARGGRWWIGLLTPANDGGRTRFSVHWDGDAPFGSESGVLEILPSGGCKLDEVWGQRMSDRSG
jgi:hypothetical protein